MLNSDMSLLKSIFQGVPRDQGTAACTYDTCADAPTAPLVRTYAADNALWIRSFRSVLVRMLTHGEEACELDVYPSAGQGLTAEQEHGVADIRSACAEQGFAPPGTVLVGGAAPPSAAPAAGVGVAPGPKSSVNKGRTQIAPAPASAARAEAEVQAGAGDGVALQAPAEVASASTNLRGTLASFALHIALVGLCVAAL